MTATILDDGFNVDDLRTDGEYSVTNPTSAPTELDPGSYFIRVINTQNEAGLRYTQQIAYNADTGDEFFRARFSSGWTSWLTRASGASVDAAAIVAMLDAYFGGSNWRDDADLDIGVNDATSLEITSSTGNSVTLESATPSLAGLLSSEDKIKIDNLSSTERISVVYDALTPVNGQRVVSFDAATGKVRNADPTDLADQDNIVGISNNAASEDDPVTIIVSGIMVNTFSFTPYEPVFLGAGGILTQTPPSNPSVFSLRVGTALADDTLLIQLERPIEL